MSLVEIASRQIYEYPDGAAPGHLTKADPAVLDRNLRAAARTRGLGWSDLYERYIKAGRRIREWNDALKFAPLMEGVEGAEIAPLTDEDMDGFVELEAKVVETIREAFKIKGFDPETGAGLLESEIFDVLQNFYLWMKKKEPSINPSPITSGSTATDLPATSNPSSGDPSITSSGTALS
jgi:hypothetical protein